MTANVISKRFHEEYRRSLIAIPTREVEYVYVERAKRGDRAAKDRLLYKYIPFLYKMAYQLRDSAYNLTVDEMVNAAIFGFPKALKEFDSSLGLLFYTYYSAKALNEMKKAGYESLLVRRPENQLKSKSFDKESVAMVQIDKAPDDGLSIMDRLTSDISSDETVVSKHHKRLSDSFMQVLSEQERAVMEHLYNADEKVTLRSIGQSMSISHERVRQLKLSALKRIRNSAIFGDIKAEADYFHSEAV